MPAIESKSLISLLISAGSVPLPRAIRFRRLRSMIFGLRRSSTVIELIIASIRDKILIRIHVAHRIDHSAHARESSSSILPLIPCGRMLLHLLLEIFKGELAFQHFFLLETHFLFVKLLVNHLREMWPSHLHQEFDWPSGRGEMVRVCRVFRRYRKT